MLLEYEALLESLAREPGFINKVCLFGAQRGRKYTGELMVIGRAVNGWGSLLHLNECIHEDYRKEALLSRFAINSENTPCPMAWVSELWGKNPDNDYSTARSAFWRSIKDVVHGLDICHSGDTEWPSHLVWSNLYKIAPDAGNPDAALCKAQLKHCIAILKAEIAEHDPKRILFLTGVDWFAPFLDDLRPRTNESQLNGLAQLSFSLPGRRVVVAKHPQGKPQAQWVREVLSELR